MSILVTKVGVTINTEDISFLVVFSNEIERLKEQGNEVEMESL